MIVKRCIRCFAVLSVLLAVPLLGLAAAEPVGKKVTVDGGTYWNIQPAQLAALIGNKDYFVVNVHVPYEGEIKGTDAFLPFDKTAELIKQFPADKTKAIVLYCRSGHMSDIAARALVKLGYTRIFNLQGGMMAWEKAGNKVQIASDAPATK